MADHDTAAAEKNAQYGHSGRKRRIHRHLTAAEVLEKLKNAGVEDLDKVSGCVKAGIARGYIQLESAADLDVVIAAEICKNIDRDSGGCSREVEATLKMVLHQDDNADDAYSGNGGSFPVWCKKCENLYCVRSICVGEATICSAEEMNHCNDCPGLGKCLLHCRLAHCEGCGKHCDRRFSCECEEENRTTDEESESDDDEDMEEENGLLNEAKKPRLG